MRRGLLVLCFVALGSGRAAAETFHVVESGQTLWKIARTHGCTVDAIKRANDLAGETIFEGQTLVVPTDCGGDVEPTTRRGQSIGSPWDGKLKAATKLPGGRGYHIRRPARAYGAAHVVATIQRAIKAVRKRFPRVHTLAIGDLSAKKGGSISEHRSHQSGRDVDVGFYFQKKPKKYPDEFVGHDEARLDLAATWALLYAFARTADDKNGVQAIFVDFDVQERLYEWAKDHGVPVRYLDRIFQYPDEGGSGLIRHVPNHHDHFHIRFKCPADDSGCEH